MSSYSSSGPRSRESLMRTYFFLSPICGVYAFTTSHLISALMRSRAQVPFMERDTSRCPWVLCLLTELATIDNTRGGLDFDAVLRRDRLQCMPSTARSVVRGGNVRNATRVRSWMISELVLLNSAGKNTSTAHGANQDCAREYMMKIRPSVQGV
ncbi:hypothetical protein BDZ89DRAFT_572866 [Hymenopellis radicata]|nr:hypothetical protein BDZ89DRAFT_572866 [Hymenopellis radicata]